MKNEYRDFGTTFEYLKIRGKNGQNGISARFMLRCCAVTVCVGRRGEDLKFFMGIASRVVLRLFVCISIVQDLSNYWASTTNISLNIEEKSKY